MSDGQHRTSRVRHQQDPVECKIDILTDELLVAILSYLSLKEAVKTSVVSRRWRYLWKYTSGCLELYDDRDKRPEAALEFMKLVNQVLKLHQGPTLDQFRVGFSFHGCCSTTEIDRWVEFAIQKEVKVLELNLAAGWGLHVGWSTYYFPDIGKLLSGGNIGKLKFSRVCSNLISLTLFNVNVKDEILQFFLSNCPCLEHICVSGSGCLQNLKVTDPLPSLKSIEIIHCYYVKCLEFDSPNLVSFTYMGPDIHVPIHNYLQLSELTIGGLYCYSFIFNADKHITYAANLRKLKLNVGSFIMRQSWLIMSYPVNFPRLNNLRKLELDILVEARHSLLFFSFFLKASPLLSRFTMRIRYSSLLPKTSARLVRHSERDMLSAMDGFVHKRLKLVKLIGFTGCKSDYKLALNLLEIGRRTLKKIILQPTNDTHPFKFNKVTLIEKRSKQLEAKLPPGVKLVML